MVVPSADQEASQPGTLPDTAVVIRGGVMTVKKLASAFEASFRDDGTYDLSVWASADLDANELALQVRERDPDCKHLPHRQMQRSTAGAVRSVGAQMLLTEPPEGHYSIRFATDPTDTQLVALMAAFEEPQPNPVPRKSTNVPNAD